MKKSSIILLSLLLLAATRAMAQGAAQNLDSLYSVWQDPNQPDYVRVNAYRDYIWNGFLFTKPDSAAVLAEALQRFAKVHQYPEAAGHGYNLQGIANSVQGNLPHALEYFEKSLAIYEEIGDKQGIANRLNNIGTIHGEQGNYPRALEYYERSLAMQQELGDKRGISGRLNNIGNIYSIQGNYPRALEYYERSLAIDEELGDKKGIAGSLNNIGLIYHDQGNFPRALEYYEKSLAINEELGDKKGTALSLGNVGTIYQKQGNYPYALEYYEKALEINEELRNKQGIAHCLNNIGTIYNGQGNYPRALEYHEKSLAIVEELGDKQGIARSLGNMGAAHQKQGNAKLALHYCKKGLALAEEIGVLEQQKYACQCLYDTYKAMGNGNEALVYLEKMYVIKDSLQVEETGKKLQQMEFAKQMLQDSLAKAEEARLVKEAHQAEVRKRSKARNTAYVGGSIALILAGGFYSRWRYVRKSRDIISKEKDRSENLLLNILPVEIAAELKEKGRADARDYDMVSILFTDFKEFTRASEKLSAKELVAEINACFEAFDAICDRYHIEKIKTIGDAYMAAGGLPVPSDDSVKNTVFAALDMQEFINHRKLENDAQGKPAFEMRVGIHTGPVVAGIVGVKKFQYDIWGDTVNTAARMESSGEVGKVNISEATYELVKDLFAFDYRGEVEAKGKGMLGMYFVSKPPAG